MGCEGMAGIIAKSSNGVIPVRFLNTNDNQVILKNFQPIEQFTDFGAYYFDSNPIFVDRVDRVLNLINIGSTIPQEKTAIEKINRKTSQGNKYPNK